MAGGRRRIGLTGGIASGKSTVTDLFRKKGAYIIDADDIAREVAAPGEPVFQDIVRHFGDGVLARTGELNRKALAKIVFSDPRQRRALNKLTHPVIRDRIFTRLEATPENRIVILSIPLLIEEGLHEQMDTLILVYSPPELQIQRLINRDCIRMEEARDRLKSQMPIDEKRAYADHIIDNSGSLEETASQVDHLWRTLKGS